MGTTATVWLALGAAFIAAGASVLTAWLGHWYALKRMTAEQTQSNQEWARERKKEAYDDALRVAHRVYFDGIMKDADAPGLLRDLATSLDIAVIFGSADVRKTALRVSNTGMEYVFSAESWNLAGKPHPTKEQEAFGMAIDTFRRAITDDMQRAA